MVAIGYVHSFDLAESFLESGYRPLVLYLPDAVNIPFAAHLHIWTVDGLFFDEATDGLFTLIGKQYRVLFQSDILSVRFKLLFMS